MWEQYRKTFLPMQAMIVIACVLLVMIVKVPVQGAIIFFLVMEVASLFGAAWGARLKRRAKVSEGSLPLHKGR